VRDLFYRISGGAGEDEIHIHFAEDAGSWDSETVSAHIDGGDDVDTLGFSQGTWFRTEDGELTDELALGGITVNMTDNQFWFRGNERIMGDEHHGEFRLMTGSILNVENVNGTQYEDGMSGDGADNVLRGYGSDDGLSGRAGDDTLVGGTGDDVLDGGHDQDILDGGEGADQLDGGDGVDTALYHGWSGVQVSLSAGAGSGGEAEGDTLVNIENVVGTWYADVIEGDSQVNVLNGAGGNDILDGAGGDDTLIGGAGADDFVFGLEFHFQESHVTVDDFAVGVDQLNLSSLDGIDTMNDALGHFTQQGANAVFAYEDSTITLQGVQVSSFTGADFIL
jgi:Ca2+-binding RTX toxin-like protein